MSNGDEPRLRRALTTYVAWVGSHGVIVLVVVAALTAMFSWVSKTQFHMNSDANDLIRQDAPWRRDFDTFKSEFPALVKTAVVVVSGESRRAVAESARRLESTLAARDDQFASVYAPGVDPFLRDHAFLYMPEVQLYDTVDQLAQAQPLLTAIARDPSLRGVLDLVRQGVVHETGTGIEHLLVPLARSAERVARGESTHVSWAEELAGDSNGTQYQLVMVKAPQHFGQALPNAVTMANLDRAIADTEIEPGVDVAVTGEIALAHEEISAALSGVQLAGEISLVLLLAIMIVGVRSIRIIAAMFLMLFIGTTWTSGYAMLTVGEYNTLSILFVVMFFGIGMDFAVQFSLRYQEALLAGEANVPALRHAAGSVGSAIVLCALTTSIGFLGFAPTDYVGLRDLGFIASGGIVIAALLTFTLLPALFGVFGPPRRLHRAEVPGTDPLVTALLARRRVFLALVVLATIGAGSLASREHFDYSVLALKDPDSESMRTLAVLQEEGLVNDYTLNVLTPAPPAPELVARLEALPSVAAVKTPRDYVPGSQADKLAVLDNLSIMLAPALHPVRQAAPADAGALRRAAGLLIDALESHRFADADVEALARRLHDAMLELLGSGDRALARWQAAVVPGLTEQLDWLRRAVSVSKVELTDLPPPLLERFVSDAGVYRSIVLPAEDLDEAGAMTRFIEQVRSVAPHATGRPVAEWGVGNIVFDSLMQALAFAVFGILVVVTLALRRAVAVILTMVPIALALTFTMAVAVLIDMPLNMANILVLPLIFGLGVHNGIYMVDRYSHVHDVRTLLHSSTPRAVVLSTLITIGTFAALALSPHRGTASIGILLTIAIGFVLLVTVVLLPVLLTMFARRADVAPGPGE